MFSFSASECDGFGNRCGQIVVTSLQSFDNFKKQVPLDEALKQYFDIQGKPRDLLEDTLFECYFLSYIEFREIWFFEALKGAAKHPNFQNGKEVYDIITNSFLQVIRSRYPVGVVEDNITFDKLWRILEKQEFRMNDDAMNDFFDFASSEYKIPKENMCETFFMIENHMYEDIMVSAWESFVSHPEDFKGKSGCMTSFAILALMLGVPLGSAMWLF